jgi:hypothetical protein
MARQLDDVMPECAARITGPNLDRSAMPAPRKSVIILLASAALSCAGNGVSADEAHRDTQLDAEGRFQLLDREAGPCEVTLESSAGKVTPSHEDVGAWLGQGSGDFIVLLEEDIDWETYPAGSPGSPATEEQVHARMAHITELQVCTVTHVESLGGTYVGSFLGLNAFEAILTLAQADQVSERSDVRFVEYETASPPP